jgi:outer membrane protein OmpA-like peptidoglycan-associated protein
MEILPYKRLFLGVLSTTLFVFCSQQKTNNKQLYRSNEFEIKINSPDTVNKNEEIFASIHIDNPRFKLIHAFFACNVMDTSTVDTLQGRIYGCNKNLITEHDSVKIQFGVGPKAGKFNFEEVTLLAKGIDNKYYYQKCTFDYNVIDTPIAKNNSTSNPRIYDTVITIYFKNKSLSINPQNQNLLKLVSQICTSDSLGFLKVVGFTDTIGTESDNDILSERRVNKVFKLLDPACKIRNDLRYLTWLGESEDVYDLHFQPTHPHQNCVDIWMQIRSSD